MAPGQDIHYSVPEYRTHHRPGYCGSNSPRSARPNGDGLPTLRVVNPRIACLGFKKKVTLDYRTTEMFQTSILWHLLRRWLRGACRSAFSKCCVAAQGLTMI
jgi:hypothetical protein